MQYFSLKPIWELQKFDTTIFNELISNDNSVNETLNKFNFLESLPYLNDLCDVDTNSFFRPKGSSRAFYIKLNSGGVIAIKGSEVLSNSISNAFKEDSIKQIGRRPWTKYENFIYREQKSPLAVYFNEGQEDQIKALEFQKQMVTNFKSLELAPIPLYTYKLPKKITTDYLEKISPYFNQRSKEIILNPLKNNGLGVVVYYYQHAPFRIAFESVKEDITLEERLKRGESNQYFSYNAYQSVEKLLLIVAKMLVSSLMPLSRYSHGIGQCIAKQNVTLLGGITDMGSIINFSEISSESEFMQLYLSCISVLTSTIREFLTSGNTSYLFEFEDPTPNAIIISNYCLNRINYNCLILTKKYNLKLPIILKNCLDISKNCVPELFQKDLSNLY